MFSKIIKISFILWIFAFSIDAVCEQEENHERSLSRQKRLLFYPAATVWQLSMALTLKISYIDSHRCALNSGFNINYNLPYNLSNFYKPTYFRSFVNNSSPIITFITRLAESGENFGLGNSEKSASTDLPVINDDVEKSDHKNEVENKTQENLEAADDNEITTTEIETTTKKTKKKKKKQKVKRDLTAAEFYSGIKDTLKFSGYHEDCLLKSICELARHPFGDHDHDVIHEIMHFVLTPSAHQGFDSETEESEKKVYEEAEEIGRSDGDCESIYASCEGSPLNSISNFVHEEVYD